MADFGLGLRDIRARQGYSHSDAISVLRSLREATYPQCGRSLPALQRVTAKDFKYIAMAIREEDRMAGQARVP